jgi:CheY-specific phosphatase CheX
MQGLTQIGIQSFVVSKVQEVFETMFAVRAVPLDGVAHTGLLNRVTGSVGLAGEEVTAAVYLHLPERLASVLASGMLEIPAEELSEADVNDVVGETTNVLAGGLKSWACDSGIACAVSTPAIIRGRAFSIETTPGITRFSLSFGCGAHNCAIEVHYKFGTQAVQL